VLPVLSVALSLALIRLKAMADDHLYTTKEASELTSASRPIIRTYTQRYARHLSTEATPEQGKERKFTTGDLRVIRFVYTLTQTSETHEQVLERLAAGELEQFDWQPPEPQRQAAPGGRYTGNESAEADPGAYLVPIERLQAAQALLQDAQRREVAAGEQVATLQAEVQRLTLELGKAQGELAGVKASRYRSPQWWRSIFGGRASE